MESGECLSWFQKSTSISFLPNEFRKFKEFEGVQIQMLVTLIEITIRPMWYDILHWLSHIRIWIHDLAAKSIWKVHFWSEKNSFTILSDFSLQCAVRIGESYRRSKHRPSTERVPIAKQALGEVHVIRIKTLKKKF